MADIPTAGMATMNVAASALRAQQQRMKIIAENMANADSVSQTGGGDPYRRQVPVFSPTRLPDGTQGVALTRVAQDQTPFKTEYRPGHPSADAKGYVKLPNVDPLVEAMDMGAAQRAYAANLSVIETAREMQSRTLDLLNK